MGYHGSFFSERLYNNPQSKNEENKGLRAVATTSFPWMKGCESSGLTRSTRMISAAGGKSPCQTSFWLPRPYGWGRAASSDKLCVSSYNSRTKNSKPSFRTEIWCTIVTLRVVYLGYRSFRTIILYLKGLAFISLYLLFMPPKTILNALSITGKSRFMCNFSFALNSITWQITVA